MKKRRHFLPATAEDRHRFDAFAEYLRANHPELANYNERRGRYWVEVKGDGSRIELIQARKLLLAWDQEKSATRPI